MSQYDAQPDDLNHEVVFNFFWRFSAFECALKREGFLHSGHHQAASADWTCFKQAMKGRFEAVVSSEFSDALDILLKAPPRRQIVKDGRLKWREQELRPDQTRESFVLGLVQTIRNNLFHGGKYPDGPVDEVARNRELLQAALLVLEECVKLRPSLKQWLEGTT